MGDGVSIPGVTDKYKTNDLVSSLMAVERKPLEREQKNLENYQTQQNAWRDVNQRMASLRESVKTLYSFENPFNNKLTSSTQEAAITADAGREADFSSFQIDVITPASADRFLSGNIDKNLQVPAGKYTYTVGEKTIDFNWKGGKLSDWVNSLNKRGGQVVKASLIGVSKNQQSLLLESLKTGEENHMVFKNQAMDFAKEIGMIQTVKSEEIIFSSKTETFETADTNDTNPQQNMPEISRDGVTSNGKQIVVPARNGFEMIIPDSVKNGSNMRMEFTLTDTEVKDITQAINNRGTGPVLPSAGGIEFKGVSVFNIQSETNLDFSPEEFVPVTPVNTSSVIFIKTYEGEEIPVDISTFAKDAKTGERTVSLSLKDYPDADRILVRNSNTGRQFTLSVPKAFDESQKFGYEPVHAVSKAQDASFKYEGITLTRPTNDIDDVIPHITLHLHDKTEKTATIKIEPDTESAKDALITFVGKYNQTLAEINILSQKKPEVIAELDYLSNEEIEKETQKLGLFFGDTTLTNGKNSLQQIVSGSYRYSEDDVITMLSQIGISTNAGSGGSGYNASQLRGYLEIDEKKLDSALESNLSEIKQIFGYDSDGDLIIDNGIGYRLDRQLTAWVQSGGIISVKDSALERNIKSSNTKISRLEDQLEKKESELKRKYAGMEGTLNSLESQSTAISNFSKQNSNQ